MAREEKVKAVDELADKLARSTLTVVTDYRGLSVSEISDLRGRLRAVGVEYHVAKNTLTRFAAERIGREAIVGDLEGPTALAIGYDEPTTAAKALNDYLRTSRILKVKGGLLGERRLSAEQVTQLAELPPKEYLQAQLVGYIQGPMAALVGVMNSLLSSVAYAVDQRSQQLQESGS